MSEILSQAEIEALLNSLSSDGAETPSHSSSTPDGPVRESGKSTSPTATLVGGKRDLRTPISYEPYDFRRPDKFAKDQLRTLQMLHETFARLYAGSLSGYLRVPAQVDLVSVEQIPYDEYIRSLTNSIISVVSLPPLAGQMILEVEFNLMLSMIDRLLGGPGSMNKMTATLTDIEKALAESILQRALRDFNNAWEGVAQFTPKREFMETQSQFVQIVPPNDVVVSILFELKVGDLRGAMSICIPYMLLKPITSKLSAQRWFSQSVKKNTGKHATQLARRLEQSRIPVTARLGKAQMSVNDVLQLNVGDVVTLDRAQSEEIEIVVGDQVKFRGVPGVRGKKLAVHVSRYRIDLERDELIGQKSRNKKD